MTMKRRQRIAVTLLSFAGEAAAVLAFLDGREVALELEKVRHKASL